MSYITLGSRGPLTAVKDTTGLNGTNYTSYFDVKALDASVANYEIYSMSVTGLVTVQTVTVYANSKVRSAAKLLGSSEWDPSQPILMKDGDELAICWDFGTGTPPAATVWLRYDPSINPRA